ncbi:MAG: TonB-dependent receptor domain-containing protein [Flavobacteriales bacterium]
MKNIFLGCLLFWIIPFSTAQIKGVIYRQDSTNTITIENAKIRLLRSNQGVFSTKEGRFEIVLPKILPDTLVISAMGYLPDSIVVMKEDRFISLTVLLIPITTKSEIVYQLRKNSHQISKMKTIHVEEIGSGELRKAACCNLSESFETNASVDVNISDAVSGAKKIQLMGLDGVYTQIQMENIPYLRGLESSFGLQSISGTWIESIQITKGTGNVVNGYESMAGLVNLELKKPQEMEKLYVNIYQNRFGRSEINLNSGIQLNAKWSTGVLGHASAMYGNVDHNQDGFRDVPMGDNMAFMNRWAYQGKKMESQFGINVYQDRKVGGQTSYFREQPVGYGVTFNSQHADLYAKTGFIFKKPLRSIGIIYNLKYQTISGAFGMRNFAGEEKRAYVNAIYDDIIGNSDHKIKFGLSFVGAQILQQVQLLQQLRTDIVPGIFAEYTYTGSRLNAVLGARYDQHMSYGGQFSPRIHAKYSITQRTDFRFTAGKGWRVPNYMMDQISLLANSKTWNPPTEIKPEISWNIGASLVKDMTILEKPSNLSIDLYHTWFEHQLVVDRDEQINAIVFKNLDHASFSTSIQIEWSFTPVKNLDIRLAYKHLEVKALYGGALRQQVMIPKNRGFLNLAYRTRNKRWEFDATCTLFGSARLPLEIQNGNVEQYDEKSPIYPMLNSQITHIYKKWNFYLGGENLTNFKQANPIIDAANPFGSNFDANRVWGPIMGWNVYVGLRYSIKNKK